MLTKGFSVGTSDGKAIYVKPRPVVRIKDLTQVVISPSNIDPRYTKKHFELYKRGLFVFRTTRRIDVKITPFIQRLSDFSNDLLVRATVSTDVDRLEIQGQDHFHKTVTIKARRTASNEMVFTFVPKKENFGVNMDNLNFNDPSLSPLGYTLSFLLMHSILLFFIVSE